MAYSQHRKWRCKPWPHLILLVRKDQYCAVPHEWVRQNELHRQSIDESCTTGNRLDTCCVVNAAYDVVMCTGSKVGAAMACTRKWNQCTPLAD